MYMSELRHGRRRRRKEGRREEEGKEKEEGGHEKGWAILPTHMRFSPYYTL